MQVETNQYCCGVVDMDGAREARNDANVKRFVTSALFQAYCNDGEDALPAHLIFTQATGNRKPQGYGFRIANYIREKELGTVTISPPRNNHNTGNYVTVFVWTPNKKADKLAAELSGEGGEVNFD